MSYNVPLASGFTGARTRSTFISPQSGMCSFCTEECSGTCEIAMAAVLLYGMGNGDPMSKEAWDFIDEYLTKRKNLCGVIQLVDLRHPPSKDDCSMYEWLVHMNHDVLVIATKCDKLNQSETVKIKKHIKADIGIENFFLTSVLKNKGIDEVQNQIVKLL